MSLENKLKEYDEKVVLHKTVTIEGFGECVIWCYPKVKDAPGHYNERSDMVKAWKQQNKHSHQKDKK